MSRRFVPETNLGYSAASFDAPLPRPHHADDLRLRPAALNVRHAQPTCSYLATSLGSVPGDRICEMPFEGPCPLHRNHDDHERHQAPGKYLDNELDTRLGHHEFHDPSNLLDLGGLKNDTHHTHRRPLPRPYEPSPTEGAREPQVPNFSREYRHQRTTYEPRPRIKPWGPRPMGSLPSGVRPPPDTPSDVTRLNPGISGARDHGANSHEHNKPSTNNLIPGESFGEKLEDNGQLDNEVSSSQQCGQKSLLTEWARRGNGPHPGRDARLTGLGFDGHTNGGRSPRKESTRSGLSAGTVPGVPRHAHGNVALPHRRSRDALRDIKQ